MKAPRLPPLDEMGAAPGVNCWRMRRESDRDYAHRLALHLQQRIVEYEQLLTAVLARKCNPQPTRNIPSMTRTQSRTSWKRSPKNSDASATRAKRRMRSL